MSTIKLNKVSWGNMFSYASPNEVDLSGSKVTQIVGVNGVGKSSIPTIIEEGLYNKNSKGFKKTEIPNRHLDKPYYVTHEFTVDGDSYSLEVHKSSVLKATMYKNGEDISAHTGSQTIKLFEDLIGLDFKTFTQLIYQNADSSLEFLRATDSKRKEFLVSLFDMAEYGDNYTVFNNALKEITQEISRIEGSIDATKSAILKAESNNSITIKELVNIPEEPDDLIQDKADIQASLNTLEAENNRIKSNNKVLMELSKLRDLEAIEADIESMGAIADKAHLVEFVGKYNAQIASAQTVISKMEKLGNSCPTCLQGVDSSFVKSLMSEKLGVITSNKMEIAKVTSDIKSIEDEEKQLNSFLKEKQNRINTESRLREAKYAEPLDAEHLTDQIRELTDKISTLRLEISRAKAHNNKVQQDNARVEMAAEQLQELEAQLIEQIDKLAPLEKQVGPLETLKKAFSPTGLVAYKLENRVKELEIYTNDYLSRLSDGKFNLSFELEKDKLNVVILDDSQPVSIVALSSGEKARVVIGTLLGIRKIMESISKTTINVLFLDEVISFMDEQGKEQLVEVLLEEEGLNTFLVSHNWSHPLVKNLEVTKKDGISVING